MTRLSTYFRRLVNWPISSEIDNTYERRADERHNALIPVHIGPPGIPPVPGLLINLSLGGAAIRISEWNAEWLGDLDQSDEMWLSGLLHTTVICWVVLVENGVLRVHFSRDDEFRNQLLEVIGKLVPM